MCGNLKLDAADGLEVILGELPVEYIQVAAQVRLVAGLGDD